MIQSLLDVTYEKDLAYTRFELEEEGWMDLVLIMYPVKTLRVEFYKDVDWQTVGDELPENMPVPLLSFFTGWHDFSFKVSLAFKNHAQESFHHFIYPAEELKLLSKRMTGG